MVSIILPMCLLFVVSSGQFHRAHLLGFPEGEDYGQQDEDETDEMVPADGFTLEDCGHDDGEDR